MSHKTLKRYMDIWKTLLFNIIAKEVRKQAGRKCEIKITCYPLLVLTTAV